MAESSIRSDTLSVDWNSIDSNRAVRDRYAAAARVRETALCCPVTYPAH